MHYGEAVVTLPYVKDNWTKMFDLLDVSILSGDMYQGRSMCGTWFNQKPIGPKVFIPPTNTVASVMPARVSVTPKLLVGAPNQGTMPNKLQNRMKKKIVHK